MGSSWLLARLPSAVVDALATAMGSMTYCAWRDKAAITRANFALVVDQPTDSLAVRRLARLAFCNYARILLEFVLFPSLSLDQIRSRVRHRGLEAFDQALRDGRGAILATPHMGNWDLAGAYSGILGYRVTTVATRFPEPIDQVVVEARQRVGLEILRPDRKTLRILEQRLAANRTVGLICDLALTGGIAVELFGGRANVPAGPAHLALKTGAALFPVIIYRDGDGIYQHEILERLETMPTGNLRADVTKLTQRLWDALASGIARHPDQWYPFHPMLSVAATAPQVV